MRTWISRFMAPPVYQGDEDKTHVALLLHYILIALLIGAVLNRSIFWLHAATPPPRSFIFWPLTLLLLGMMILMRRGYVQLASIITVIGLWLALSAYNTISGGFHSPGFRSYVIPVLIAGLLLGHVAALATAGL